MDNYEHIEILLSHTAAKKLRIHALGEGVSLDDLVEGFAFGLERFELVDKRPMKNKPLIYDDEDEVPF